MSSLHDVFDEADPTVELDGLFVDAVPVHHAPAIETIDSANVFLPESDNDSEVEINDNSSINASLSPQAAEILQLRSLLNSLLAKSAAQEAKVSTLETKVSSKPMKPKPSASPHDLRPPNCPSRSGMKSLMALCSDSNFSGGDDGIAVGLIIHATTFSETDPLLAFQSECNSSIAYSEYLQSVPMYKLLAKRFEDDFARLTDVNALRSSIKAFYSHLVSIQNTSAETAVQIFLHMTTRLHRLAMSPADVKKSPTAVMNVVHSYLFVEDSGVSEFKVNCNTKTLDPALLSRDIQPFISDPQSLPGYARLTHIEPDIRSSHWIDLFLFITSFLLKGPPSLTRGNEEALFFVGSNTKHHLCQEVNSQGLLEPIYEWLPRELFAFNRLSKSSTILGFPSMIPDDFMRIRNALQLLHPIFITEIYTTIRNSSSWSSLKFVEEDPGIPSTRPIPAISWREFSIILTDSFKRFLLPPTLGKVQVSAVHKQTASSVTKISTDCRSCGGAGHVSAVCTVKPPTELCRNHTTVGRTCRHKNNCKYFHPVIAPPPTAMNPMNPSSLVLTDPSVAASDRPVHMINIKCKECNLEFSTDENWWTHPQRTPKGPLSVPNHCKACRQLRKQAPRSYVTTVPISSNIYEPLMREYDSEEMSDEEPEDFPHTLMFRSSPSHSMTESEIQDQFEFEVRMRMKYEPGSEIAKLAPKHVSLTPANRRRISKPPDRFIPDDMRTLLIADVIPAEINAASVDDDLDTDDSIDLASENEFVDFVFKTQTSLTSFFPVISKTKDPAIAAVEEINPVLPQIVAPTTPFWRGIPISTNSCEHEVCHCFDTSSLKCSGCYQCLECCGCMSDIETSLPYDGFFTPERLNYPSSFAAIRENGNRRMYRASVCFVKTSDQWVQTTVCFDSLSQITLVSPRIVQTSWRAVSPPSCVIGAGNQVSKTKGEIEIPAFAYTYHGTLFPVIGTIVDLPDGVDVIIGLPHIHDHCITNEETAFRMHVRRFCETIRMDYLHLIIQRLRSPPLNILSLCGGIEPQIHILLSLGFRINNYWSVENSEITRLVASANYPPIKHIFPHDISLISTEMIASIVWDAVFAGFPCQSFSSRNDHPDGDMSVFTHGSAIIDLITADNPDVFKFIENVVPSHSLTHIAELQDSLLHCIPYIHNASQSGSPASRPRRYWLDSSVSPSDYITISHICPSFLLSPGYQPEQIPLPCLMASINTSSPPMVFRGDSGSRRQLTQDERDRINPGLAAGITTGYGLISVDERTRNKLNGNCFNADELWQVLRLWPIDRTKISHSLSTQFDMQIAEPDSIELFFAQMTDSECWDYLQNKAMNDGLEMPLLELITHANQTIPHQTKIPGLPSPRLSPSADYCADLLIKDGSHVEVEYSCDFWICLLFFKDKCRPITAEFDHPMGTYKAGDILHALRPLKDQRVLNSAVDCPPQWSVYSPERDELIQFLSHKSKFFAPYDACNAYHDVKLTTRSRKFCVSSYTDSKGNRRFLQALGGSQGLSAMGTFFPAWIRYGYCFFFGLKWMLWWIQFIDDGMAHADEENRCRNRYRLMVYSQLLMGLTPSPKHIFNISTSTAHVGMQWTGSGVCLPDDAVICLAELLILKPSNLTESRRLRGVILQSIGAFSFDRCDKLRFTELMIPLNNLITEAEKSSSKRITWTDHHSECMLELSKRITNAPRAYHDPNWIMSEDRCIALVSDADPNAIAGYMVSVARSDARDITVDDLLDPNMSVLLAFYPKILNKAQRRWPIIEKEVFGHIHLHRKTHQFINTVIFKFSLTEPAVPKLLYAGDNKSGMRQRESFHLPNTQCEYLTAKCQRTTGWTEETAVTAGWPSTGLDLPGESNNLADMTCRFAAMFRERLENPIAIPVFDEMDDMNPTDPAFALTERAAHSLNCCFSVIPSSLNVCAIEEFPLGLCKSIPEGHTAHILPLTSTQWRSLPNSYSSDRDEYNGVSMSDVYSVMTGTFEGSKVVRSRVDAWLGKIFFHIPISVTSGETVSVVFTISSAVRPTLGFEVDDTKHLVMVIPSDLQLRISNRTEDHQFYGDDQELWSRQNTTRSDILWLSHDSHTPHQSAGLTILAAKRLGWWPSIELDAKRHITWCSLCSSHRLRLHPIGSGQRCSLPFSVWQIDDKIITDDAVVKMTGCVSILTMVESTTGLALFAPRKTKASWEVGHIVYVHIVAVYGVPLSILSDHASEYIQEVGMTICSIMGIPMRITCSKGSHCKMVESKQRAVSAMLEQASAKGDLRSYAHLELYTASLQIKENQLITSDGTTVFERVHGLLPNTVADLLTVPYLSESQLLLTLNNTKLSVDNKEFLLSLHNRCKELIELRNAMSDTRSRYSMANRLSNSANVHRATESIQVGDVISMEGAPWTVERIKYSPGGSPISALISDLKETFKWIKYDLLTPLSVPVPQNMLPIINEYIIGDTVFYYDGDYPDRSRVCCGDILSVSDDHKTIELHVRQHNDSASTWLPRWTNPAKPNAVFRHNYGKQKPGMIPFTDSTSPSEIICIAHLTEGNFLMDDSYYYLKSRGIDINPAQP